MFFTVDAMLLKVSSYDSLQQAFLSAYNVKHMQGSRELQTLVHDVGEIKTNTAGSCFHWKGTLF